MVVQVMNATLKAAIADEDGMDMLGTIAVPKNLKRMTLDLPAPCYPDTRPHSPEAWPATDPRRVSSSLAVSCSPSIPPLFFL